MRTKSNATRPTGCPLNINPTKCLMTALLFWLCVVIFFIAQMDRTTSSNPTVIGNHKQSVSFMESISPELSASGWKPLYIHTRNVRMPVQEMDYLLETYWHPRIKERQSNDDSNGNSNDDDYVKHDTVNNLDEKLLRKKRERTIKDRRLIGGDHSEKADEHSDKLRDAPSLVLNSKVSFPSDWSSPCIPGDLHNIECILKHMMYWKKGVSKIEARAPVTNQYVTFLKDCGGFNNIRQGFEFHAMIAWVTGRTLVIPPDIGWYLIDFGSMTRGREAKNEVNFPSWPDGADRRSGVSNYDIWFDLDDLCLVVPVITTSEFIRREFDSLSIPMEFQGGDIVNLDQSKADQYLKWINQKATDLNVNLPWGQLANLLYWPSIESVETKNSDLVDGQFVDNRKKREYTPFLQAAKFIHFPSCAKGVPGTEHDFRYLGQIARSIAFDSKEQDRKYKQVLRDHIHLNRDIMEYAAMVVRILGAFNYASLHIRRNELQYKYVFAEAPDSFNNIRQLIGEDEVLYISTDEKKDDFFKVFEENGKRKVYRWKDFFGPDAVFEATKNVVIPGKLHGEVEMAICAMGRIFFGTKESTFSQYIGVLRGYFDAPYKHTLYHHYKLTDDADESMRISRANPGKPYAGQIYKIPFPDLWEDIQDLP